jgi:hypothetical protein
MFAFIIDKAKAQIERKLTLATNKHNNLKFIQTVKKLKPICQQKIQ